MVAYLLLTIHFIPVFVVFITSLLATYQKINKGSTIIDFIKNYAVFDLAITFSCITIPIVNYVIMYKSIEYHSTLDGLGSFPSKIKKFVMGIFVFIYELIYGIILLIIWIFKLKYVFRFFQKIFLFKIK